MRDEQGAPALTELQEQKLEKNLGLFRAVLTQAQGEHGGISEQLHKYMGDLFMSEFAEMIEGLTEKVDMLADALSDGKWLPDVPGTLRASAGLRTALLQKVEASTAGRLSLQKKRAAPA